MRRNSVVEWIATVASLLLVYATLPLAALVWTLGKIGVMLKNRKVWVIVILLLPFFYWSWWFWGSSGSATDPVEIEVKSGTTFAAFTQALTENGVVNKPTLFRIMARLSRIDRNLHVGLYRFEPESSPYHVLSQLANHEQIYLRFTVVEGTTIKEMLPEIAARLAIPVDSLETEVRNPDRLAKLGISTESLEGYLFPETYTVRWGADAREVVDVMLEQFDRVWKDVSDGPTHGLSRHELVTLASLIEAEARDGNERRLISSVFHNRLDRKMKLQCDPTVIYAMGGLDRLLTRKDWEYDSPYNTYRIRGLPPGPICSPGRASLEAALHPDETDYLYFMAQGDGTHAFSRTLAEHEAAYRKVKREQRR